ncbi:4-(cytidine 5'-diphospho)-2-C-methyl-D-erythritol kinase [Candidatus Latescibacterota bacterium]
MQVTETAYAKINLGLKILGKRPDGFHSILSIFQTVTLADTLVLSSSGEPGFVSNDPAIPSGPENLVLKAETLLNRYHGPLPRVRFVLDKHIPVGAGLGGGSSDAARALCGLNTIHGLNLSDTILQRYATEIGSDVPFFIAGGNAIVSGRGEVIEPVDWPFLFNYVLVYPGSSIATTWAYRHLNNLGGNILPYRETIKALKAGKLKKEKFLRSLENDFEESVFHAYPEIGAIKEKLLSNGADAAVMSGSGSTMVGIFIGADDARRCTDILKTSSDKLYTVFSVRAAAG